MSKTMNLGLILTEVVITVALLAVLVIIAIPTYHSYSRRQYFSSIVQATMPYRAGVEQCYNTTGTLNHCDSATPGIPQPITSDDQSEVIKRLTVKDGTITVVPKPKHGITTQDDYILTPEISRGEIRWDTAGGSVANGYAN